MLTARQQHCLNGIGIRTWTGRSHDPADGTPGDSPIYSDELPPPSDSADEKKELSPLVGETESSPVASKRDCLRAGTAPGDSTAEMPGENHPFPANLDSWEAVIDAIHACTACELSQNCTQKVPGVGDHDARLLIVGEGPGHDEDIRGEPFVGRSGQLLDLMLAAIGISRKQVYITNIVKCRPPGNRDPKQDEALHCRACLDAQIELISPRVILSVGRVSAHNLLGSNEPVGKLIKQTHKLPGTDIPLKVTYHPAYLLRNPSAKSIAWQDLKLLHRMLK